MIFIILVLLGLCFGSFANALVWRIHQQEKTSNKKPKQKLSILHGRSMCTSCKHVLGFLDLIPVFSWVFLRGKCRYCSSKISPQYPIVEISTSILYVFSYKYWPYGLESRTDILVFAFWLIFLVGFVSLFIYDLKWMILPNRIIYPLIGLAAFQVLVLSATLRDWTPIYSGIVGVLCSAGFFYALFQLSSGKWIGGGDVKLAVVIGLIVGGATNAILVLFIASLIGSIVTIPMVLVSGNKKTKVPFGPFLIVATIIVYLFGSALSSWYITQMGL